MALHRGGELSLGLLARVRGRCDQLIVGRGLHRGHRPHSKDGLGSACGAESIPRTPHFSLAADKRLLQTSERWRTLRRGRAEREARAGMNLRGGELECSQSGSARPVSTRRSACSSCCAPSWRCSARPRRAPRRRTRRRRSPGVTHARVPAAAARRSEICTIKAGPDAERRRAQADDRLGRRRRVRRPDGELHRPRDREPDRADRRHVHVPARAATTAPSCSSTTTLVIDHDGLHGAEDKDGAVELTAGTHALRVNFFEAGGGQELRAQLAQARRQRASPSSRPRSLSTDSGVVRVTAPGTKQCEGDDRHARRRAAARRRQPRLRPRQPAPGRLRAEGDRPGVDGRRPARPDLGRRRRRPEQRDRPPARSGS